MASPLDTTTLLAQLDTIASEIPPTIAYLAQAVNTLRDLDPARGDVWARNLAGLGGQYYGRLDRIQSTLRRVVRALRERDASPYAIRPPLPSTALPPAFTPATSPRTIPPPTDQAPQQMTPETTSTDPAQLSTYALRLEVDALADLQGALREMQCEVARGVDGVETMVR
ncbi:hypothetical protein NliqN6_2484 [Naganishia liquefaciens]|uniref:Uncharacterized protein n=1 Tax=Naganishia liquefaciens TaxID=104408 RepID=A0A8H3YFC3_9TREE|nr:hypothetical protein NliqN6_2484 [Naganishia liquefaciens]